MFRKYLKLFVLVGLLGLTPQNALGNSEVMQRVIRIAEAISVVQPNLPEEKYIEYALGIYRASKRYQIRPTTLIAIAHQETSFREALPEGAAGEIGITQILKRWRSNPKFIREFGNVSIKDIGDPSKSFLFSAWILRQLRDNEKPGALPYWSYYNARKFRHRLRYFTHVNRHLARIQRGLPKVVAKREAKLAMAGFPAPPRAPAQVKPLPAITKKMIPKRSTKTLNAQASIQAASLLPGT